VLILFITGSLNPCSSSWRKAYPSMAECFWGGRWQLL